jgi:hypothetical protein
MQMRNSEGMDVKCGEGAVISGGSEPMINFLLAFMAWARSCGSGRFPAAGIVRGASEREVERLVSLAVFVGIHPRFENDPRVAQSTWSI